MQGPLAVSTGDFDETPFSFSEAGSRGDHAIDSGSIARSWTLPSTTLT
jgi:hypothetical protein